MVNTLRRLLIRGDSMSQLGAQKITANILFFVLVFCSVQACRRRPTGKFCGFVRNTDNLVVCVSCEVTKIKYAALSESFLVSILAAETFVLSRLLSTDA